MTLTELLALLERLGSVGSEDLPGLTELDHGLQCAFELAQRRPADVTIQIAGLVHDIGHLFGSDEEHGRAGAAAVRPLLGDRVADVVEAHVVAKRYLVATDPDYRSLLSPGSTTSLGIQGGPLSKDQENGFRASPAFEDAVLLRRADDSAKVAGRAVPGLSYWVPILRQVVRP